MFLAQGCRGLADCGGVCVTDAYEFLDGSEIGCTRSRASANEMFSLYFRVTMSFSCFHIGQSLEIARWSPSQFTHFGSFRQSSTLCSSSPHPAQTGFPLHEFFVCPNFWHWKHLWRFVMQGLVSFFKYPMLIFSGMTCPLIVIAYIDCNALIFSWQQ